MAVLPIQPVPFFENKNRAFWNLQFIGWGGALLLRSASAIAGRQEFEFIIVILIGMITGFSISLVLSVVYRQLMSQRPIVTWSLSALALAVGVSVMAFLDSWVITLYRPDSETSFATLVVGIFFFDLVLLGAWSALYYAINFYLKIEQQADVVVKLEAQASSAQLAMLRYQLNPHFLFNTLNSISTLVLLKQTDQANAMLTRLSAFLRHTLVSQPGGTVTVAQEVETLKLYLDIERMRFEERLRTSFRVSHEAADAALPALLLQPLIENAVKYAVSPQEEGAKISLVAQRVGKSLRVTVSDTGPGFISATDRARLRNVRQADGIGQTTSTGVGLQNIRNRLSQAYGDDHRFHIETPAEGGFKVTIELPYENFSDEDAIRHAPPKSGPMTLRKPALASGVDPSVLNPSGTAQ